MMNNRSLKYLEQNVAYAFQLQRSHDNDNFNIHKNHYKKKKITSQYFLFDYIYFKDHAISIHPFLIRSTNSITRQID